MAYTFLQAVNAALTELGLITSDLTSFTNSSKQTAIENIKKAWNDTIAEVYRAAQLPGEIATSTFTLATSTREYSYASDFVKMAGNPVTPTKQNRLVPYPGGWFTMREVQINPSSYTGQPHYWVINPATSKIRIDTDPTSAENGDVYTYAYEKYLHLVQATDTFAFGDDVVDALQGAVVQFYNLKQKGAKAFVDPLYRQSISLATHKLVPERQGGSWGVRRTRAVPQTSTTFNP